MEQVYAPNFTVNQLDTFVDRLTYRSDENIPRPVGTMGSSNRESHPVVKDTHNTSWQKQQQDSMIRNGFRVKQQQGQQEQKQQQQQQQQQQQNNGQIKDRNRLSNQQQQQQHHSFQRNQQKKRGENTLEQSLFNMRPISHKSTAPHIVDITADRNVDVAKDHPARRLGLGQNVIDLCVIDDVETPLNTRLHNASRNSIISGHARVEVEVDDYDDINPEISNQRIEKRGSLGLMNRRPRPGPFTSIADHDTDYNNSNYSSDNGGGKSSSSSSSSSSSGNLNRIKNNNNSKNDSSSNNNSGSSSSNSSGQRGSVYSSRQNISRNDGKCEKISVSPLRFDHGDLHHSLQSTPHTMRKVVGGDITDLRDDVISSSYAVEERSSLRNGHRSIGTRRNLDSGLVLPSTALLNDACSIYFNTSLREDVQQVQKGSSSVSGSGSGSSSVTKNVNQSSSKNALKRKRDSLIDLTDDSPVPVARKISPLSSTHDGISARPSTRTRSSQNNSDNSRLLQDGTGSRVSNVGSVGDHNSDTRDVALSMSSRLLQNVRSKMSNTQNICGLLVKRPSSFHPSGPFTSHPQSQSMRQG